MAPRDADRGQGPVAERAETGPRLPPGRSWIDPALWGLAVAAVALTVWFSLGPAPRGPGSDRQMHAVAYFADTLTILLAIVWRPGRGPGRSRTGTRHVAVALLVLGGLIELAQGGFVHRDAQLADWFADAGGIAIAVVVFGALRWALRGRSSPSG